jgi:hypothetical protein
MTRKRRLLSPDRLSTTEKRDNYWGFVRHNEGLASIRNGILGTGPVDSETLEKVRRALTIKTLFI